jgi:hypothetical protein
MPSYRAILENFIGCASFDELDESWAETKFVKDQEDPFVLYNIESFGHVN